jgi:hypothetical protein
MDTRIHFVLPKAIVKEIDELVGPRKRSEFIANTIENQLIRERQLKAIEQTAGILKAEDYPEWSTPEKVSAWVRRSRQIDNDRLNDLLEQWKQ